MELPVKFKEQMKGLLQDEYEDYLQSFDHERYYGLRINTLKISVEEFLKISPLNYNPSHGQMMASIIQVKINQVNTPTIMQAFTIFKNQVLCYQHKFFL